MKCLIIHSTPQSQKNLNSVIDCAKIISESVDAVIFGEYGNLDQLGINNIWHYPAISHVSAKAISEIIAKHQQGYSHILTHSDTHGKNYLPYFCGQNNLPMISEVISVENADTFQRAIYAGSAIETIKSNQPVKVLSIRGIYFNNTHTGTPIIETCEPIQDQYAPKLLEEAKNTSSLPDLASADIVVSGGRGFGGKENFETLYTLAKHYNCAIGASRAAVDAGYIGNEHQVGQTGKQIAPKLYFSFGISGAVQHLSGMKDSQVIIAVDKDADAPIFKIAQYGYVGDLFDAIKRLMDYKPN